MKTSLKRVFIYWVKAGTIVVRLWQYAYLLVRSHIQGNKLL